MDALPVIVQLEGWLGEQVSAHVEQQLGWQVVGGCGLEPALALAGDVVPGTPTVVVHAGEARPCPAGALAAIGWPAQRALLAELAIPSPAVGSGVRAIVVASRQSTRACSVVALGLAGAQAWSGLRVALIGSATTARLAGVPPPPLTTTALAATPTATRARVLVDEAAPVPGVAGLWLLSGPPQAASSDWGVDVVVVDGGDPDHADVLVATAPVAHRRAVVTHGRQLRRLQHGRQRVLVLPRSSRVARAATLGRVPAALPGRTVAALSWLVSA